MGLPDKIRIGSQIKWYFCSLHYSKLPLSKYQYFLLYPSTLLLKGYKRKYWYFDNESFENKNHKSYHLISLVTRWMFTKQTDSKFEKWVKSGLSTFEIRRLVAEIYFRTFNLLDHSLFGSLTKGAPQFHSFWIILPFTYL